jgi:tRNA(fMet)-specific endonuclease VapC
LTKYLLDTDICIYYLKGLYNLDAKIDQIGQSNCYLSEITVAELKYGAENSAKVEHNRKVVQNFIQNFTILPVFSALDVYAKEKSRLRKAGKPIDDFDLLIAATAVENNFVLVTNNEKHFGRMKGLKVENWSSEISDQ